MDAIPSKPQDRREKILVRGVNWLGDAIMTTPALRRLREARPDAEITLLSHEKLVDLWRGFTALDGCLCFSSKESIWRVARKIRAGSFQTALILPNSIRSAWEAWLGGVPQRIGFAAPWRNWWLTHAIDRRPGIVVMRKRSVREIRALVASESMPTSERTSAVSHHLYHYLHLVGSMGANSEPLPPQLDVSEEEVQSVCSRIGLSLGTNRPLLGLNAGAEYGPAKRWPLDRFLAAALAVYRQTDCQWLVFGGTGDRELASALTVQLANAIEPSGTCSHAVVNLAGTTTLRELCALIKACRVLLTNDTGPMHLAAAVNTPVVVPFGSTSPELTGPGLPGDPRHHLLQARVPCAPCFLRECPIDFRCMHAITVEQVVAAVLRALDLTEQNSRS
jgi:heptosyltransferase-2